MVTNDKTHKTTSITIRLTEAECTYLKKLALQHGEDDKNPWEGPNIYVVDGYREEFIVNNSRRAWRDNDLRYIKVIRNKFEDLLDIRRMDGEKLPRLSEVSGTTINGVKIYNPETYCESFGIPAVSGRVVKYSRHEASAFIKEEAEAYARLLQNTGRGDFRVREQRLKGYRENKDMLVFRRLLMKMGKRLINEGAAKGDSKDTK